jgi:hypothetical protein
MIGQGGPKASRAHSALVSCARRILCAAAALACALCASGSSALAADVDVRLRVAWGGGAERVWHGTIEVSEGQVAELQPLGIEADEPGSMWLPDKNIVEVRQRSARTYDGFDCLVTAGPDAQLTITLGDDSGEAPKQVEVPLRALLHQPHNSALDDLGNRLLISRAPSDRLRVIIERPSLIFSPGESFGFEVEPHLSDVSGKFRFQAQLTNTASGTRVWAEEFDAAPDGEATGISLKLPDVEGVYDLAIAAAQSTRLRPFTRKPLAERRIQVVVLDSRAQGEEKQVSARILEINPMNPRWWDRLGNLPLMPGLRRGPLGNGDAAAWEHPTLGPLIQLGPGGAAPDVSWEAYPLPISTPGQPHVLEIEYPSDVPQSMGISLLEPNAAGAVVPIGLDSGVYVSDEEAESTPQLAKHRMVFWPRTKTPLLLITNRRAGSRAVYGKIGVLGPSHSQIPGLSLSRTDGGSLIPPAFSNDRPAERLMAGYLDRPLFNENFGAPESLDPANHRSLDDWNTFYQGGTRLVKYLKYVGYSGLMLSAYADGSTIYPSQVLEPTPRYDTGVFFSTGQDPTRKDALELLFRLFDREGMTLIPALNFAAPLVELEAMKRVGGAHAVGIEWIGADGKAWLSSNVPRQGLAPYYNLLDPRVQEAMLNVAREVATRYAHHRSFAGLALQLSPDGFAQLPGEEWGFDDQTIARFEREARTKVPGKGAERFAARAKYLTGPGRTAWIEWRARVVNGFHRRLQSEISDRVQNGKLYLAGGTMLDNRQTQYRLRPALPRRVKLDEALLELGIHAQAYQNDPGIVFLRPQQLRPPAGSALKAPDLESSLTPGEIDRLFAGQPHSGSLFYHEPQKLRLASFDAKSPFGPSNTYLWQVSELSPSGDRNRRRFAHSLASLDAQEMFDGGWLLPLGQEESLRDMVGVYRSLPRGHFETVPGALQPVTIRTLSRDRQTYAYLVNDSPWEISVTMRIEAPRECALEKLGASRGVGPLTRNANEVFWKVTLRPYELAGAKFNAAGVKLRTPRVAVSEQVRLNLQQRIRDLIARVAALGNPQPIGQLQNANFDLPVADGAMVGWSVAGDGYGAAVDSEQKHSGAYSLKLASGGAPVKVTSAPFDPPSTGRLAVELWLRASGGKRDPALKISVEGEMPDSRFEPYGIISDPYGVISGVNTTAAAPGDWVRYTFPLDYLPSEGLSELRIGLELQGAGDIWIDDVQVFDLAFSDAERYELSKLITQASVMLVEKGQLSDCAQLLEGYWPQFLVAHVPLAQGSLPVAQRTRDTRAPAKKSNVLENLRDYLPRMPRR